MGKPNNQLDLILVYVHNWVCLHPVYIHTFYFNPVSFHMWLYVFFNKSSDVDYE